MATRIRFHETGNPEEVLKLETFHPGNPGPGEIRVEMRFAPINPADLNIIEGKYGIKLALPADAGLEGAGVVAELGTGVVNVRVGDHVFPPDGQGAWCSEFIAPAESVTVVPKGLSDLQAATLRVNPCTAWRMLNDFVSLKPGDWVVQNASNSAVGRHVIQIAHAEGWRTVNLVRREELILELKELGGDVVLLDDDHAPTVAKTALQGHAPTLAFNAVGGESALRVCKMLAPGSPVITYGGMSRKPITLPTGFLIFNDLKFQGFWVSRWWKNATPEARTDMLESVAHLARTGRLEVPVDRVFPLNEIKAAVARAAEGSRNGKVLLDLSVSAT